MRKVVALFDEYQSKEIAKHVLRSMKENARQGYWNGARPPYGYKAVAVEQRGARIKKRLEIDVVEAEQVRLIYRLFLEGHGGYRSHGHQGHRELVERQWPPDAVGRDLGHWAGTRDADEPSLHGRRALQHHGLENADAQIRDRARHRRGADHRRPADLRAGAVAAEGAQSARQPAARRLGADPADRPRVLRDLLGRHDAAHGDVEVRRRFTNTIPVRPAPGRARRSARAARSEWTSSTTS